MQPPYNISSPPNSLVLSWGDPVSSGGCPLTGFAIFRDNSIGGEVTVEVNTNDDPQIRNNAVLK